MAKTTDLTDHEVRVPEHRWRKGDDSTIKSPALKLFMVGVLIFAAYSMAEHAGLVDKIFAAFAQ